MSTTAHPITVKPFQGRVIVETPDGEVLVDTRSALELKESTYPAVYYVPRADTKMARLAKTQHHTHCPYKGDASYFTITDQPAATGENAVWTYEQPLDAAAGIKEALAFYPNKLKIKATPDA